MCIVCALCRITLPQPSCLLTFFAPKVRLRSPAKSRGAFLMGSTKSSLTFYAFIGFIMMSYTQIWHIKHMLQHYYRTLFLKCTVSFNSYILMLASVLSNGSCLPFNILTAKPKWQGISDNACHVNIYFYI